MKGTLSVRSVVVCLLVLVLRLDCRAQEYAFEYFGVEQGLTNLAIKALFQDRAGFIWVATENGVFRYEGVRFRQFTPEQGLPASVTASLGETPDGDVLVGNQAGLFRLRHERFERVPLPDPAYVNGYNSILQAGARTWIGTDRGLYFAVVENGALTLHAGPEPPPGAARDVQSVHVSGSGLWWGCGDALCSEEDGAARVYSEADGLLRNRVLSILHDRENNLWVNQNRRMMVRKAGEARFQDADPSLPPTGPGGAPCLDLDGRLLVPTTEGLAILVNGSFHIAGRSSGLLPPVFSVLQDREGSVWLGLAGRGLARWRGYSQWESFSATSGLTGETVYEIMPDRDGSVWVGTEAGFFHGRRGNFQWAWHRIAALGQMPVHAVQRAADGSLWLGTDGRGLARFNPRTAAIQWFGRPEGLDGNSPYAVLIDKEQNVWAGTEAGIFVRAPGAARFRLVEGVPAKRCWVLLQTETGDIWAGGSGGLWLRQADGWRNFTRADGLKADAVISLASNAGALWVGYRLTGAITSLRFEGGSPARGNPALRHFEPPLGRDANITYFLGFDRDNRLWAGTNLGVHVLDPATGRQDRYDHHDGLIWDDCDLHAFAAEADGHLWIGTSGGLSRFAPRATPIPVTPPRTVFTSVSLGRNRIDAGSAFTMPYSSEPLVARFTALRFGRDRDLTFRYQLTPLIARWKETVNRELQFPALPPGKYRLEVQARDSKGGWSENTAVLDFRVIAPWWRTWWALGGYMAAGLLCGGLFWRRRSAREEAVRHALEDAVDERTRQLSHQYRHDVLTGLPNRLLFGERLSSELLTAARRGTRVAVLFIDLDRFKRINDTWGHQTGDLFLKQIAARLRAALLPHETIGRIGGDEFLVLIPGLADKTEAATRGRALLAALRTPVHLEGKNVYATMSVGVAAYPDDAGEPTTLMAAADAAMYRAKSSGKNQVRLFEAAMTEAASRPQNIEDRLREALNTGGFLLHYQPQYTLNGVLQGFEALLRLRGSGGEVSPGEFIPIAEESGLIIEMGAWVMHEACRQTKAWHDAGFPGIRISVNVSVMQLAWPGFEAQLLDTIGRTGMNPERLELELTETALVKDTGDSADLLKRIRARGIQVALDDFGTGYSPMQYLHELPVDVVKIDQVFVRDLDGSPSSVPLVEGMVKLAKTLSLRVVAEGVETKFQYDIVNHIGFDIVQGNLTGVPVSPEEAEGMLRRGLVRTA